MWEILKHSVSSVRSSGLRSVLTIAIIAVGITSLVGVLTAIEALSSTLEESYGRIGASESVISGEIHSPLSVRDADTFTANYSMPEATAIYSYVAHNAVVSSFRASTNPVNSVAGVSRNFLKVKRHTLTSGRDFSAREISEAEKVAVIGDDVAEILFPDEDPLGGSIMVGGTRFRVIGTMEQNSFLIFPYTVGYGDSRPEYHIAVNHSFFGNNSGDSLLSEISPLMRGIRGLSPREDPDFTIESNQMAVEEMRRVISLLVAAALIIGFVTMLGAAVGLMNIMLVAVRERRRETGTLKAIGARSLQIKVLFLAESALMALAGSAIGVAAGLTAGALVADAMEIPFVMPWRWIMAAVTVSLAVSLLSGYLPAKKASESSPMEALREE